MLDGVPEVDTLRLEWLVLDALWWYVLLLDGEKDVDGELLFIDVVSDALHEEVFVTLSAATGINNAITRTNAAREISILYFFGIIIVLLFI